MGTGASRNRGLGRPRAVDLRVAAAAGDIGRVRGLLAAHVDALEANAAGQSALHLAARGGHWNVIEELLATTIAPLLLDVQDKTHGETALHEAAFWGHARAVATLLQKGCDRNLQSRHGRTALHEASMCGHADVVRTLLDERCDPGMLFDQGCKYVMMARLCNGQTK